jgi:hypothetical protein
MKLLGKGAHAVPEAVPAPDSAGGGAVQARGAYEVDGERRMAYACGTCSTGSFDHMLVQQLLCALLPLHHANILARSLYADHMVSPEEVAERYNVAVDWKNIGGSKGLTSQQVYI